MTVGYRGGATTFRITLSGVKHVRRQARAHRVQIIGGMTGAHVRMLTQGRLAGAVIERVRCRDQLEVEGESLAFHPFPPICVLHSACAELF